MIIALTIWGERISPVFDSAHMLMVVNVQGSEITTKRYEPFEPAIPFLLSEKLSELKIEVLICGAISTEPADIIESAGIKLISFISGNAENVLASHLKGEILTAKFIMPGCGRKRGRGGCGNGQSQGQSQGHGQGQGCGCGRNMIK